MTVSLAPEPPKWRIVVTDDDPRLLAQWSSILRGAGHIVFAAYNGFVAWQEACTIPDLDLLITNTRLSGLDAPELIRRVRQVRPQLPILHIGNDLPAEGWIGMVPSLSEPVSPASLLAKVADLLAPPTDRT